MTTREDTRPGLVLRYHPNDGNPQPGAPPHKYNREIHDKIVLGIRSGFTPEHVAAANGISATAFREWIRKGVAGDPWLAEFAEDVEAARAYALLFHEAVIQNTLRLDDLTPKERLAQAELSLKVQERIDPNHWSKQVQHIVMSHVDGMMSLLERGLTPKEFEKVCKVLSAPKNSTAEIEDDE